MAVTQVKVGQVWRCGGGAELTVTAVTTHGHVHFDDRGVSVWEMLSDMTPANGWELVSDVGCCGACPDCQPIKNAFPKDRAPKPDTCGAPEGCASGDKWITSRAQVVTVSRYDAASNNVFFNELPGGMFPEGLQKYGWARPGDGSCLALRASLPVSAEFVESHVMEARDSYFEDGAFYQSKADLRRKASTLRAWPLCPVSQEPLGVEACVREQNKEYGFWAGETLRTWRASFTCPCCAGVK